MLVIVLLGKALLKQALVDGEAWQLILQRERAAITLLLRHDLLSHTNMKQFSSKNACAVAKGLRAARAVFLTLGVVAVSAMAKRRGRSPQAIVGCELLGESHWRS